MRRKLQTTNKTRAQDLPRGASPKTKRTGGERLPSLLRWGLAVIVVTRLIQPARRLNEISLWAPTDVSAPCDVITTWDSPYFTRWHSLKELRRVLCVGLVWWRKVDRCQKCKKKSVPLRICWIHSAVALLCGATQGIWASCVRHKGTDTVVKISPDFCTLHCMLKPLLVGF